MIYNGALPLRNRYAMRVILATTTLTSLPRQNPRFLREGNNVCLKRGNRETAKLNKGREDIMYGKREQGNSISLGWERTGR